MLHSQQLVSRTTSRSVLAQAAWSRGSAPCCARRERGSCVACKDWRIAQQCSSTFDNVSRSAGTLYATQEDYLQPGYPEDLMSTSAQPTQQSEQKCMQLAEQQLTLQLWRACTSHLRPSRGAGGRGAHGCDKQHARMQGMSAAVTQHAAQPIQGTASNCSHSACFSPASPC